MVSKRNVCSYLLIGIVIMVSLTFVGCMGGGGQPATLSGNITLDGIPLEHPVVIEIVGFPTKVVENGTYEFTGLESGPITLKATTTLGYSTYRAESTWPISGGPNTHDIKFRSKM